MPCISYHNSNIIDKKSINENNITREKENANKEKKRMQKEIQTGERVQKCKE